MFNIPNFFGATCPRYESDPTKYGSGTQYPIGLSFDEMRIWILRSNKFFWGWTASADQSGDCNHSACGDDGDNGCICSSAGDGEDGAEPKIIRSTGKMAPNTCQMVPILFGHASGTGSGSATLDFSDTVTDTELTDVSAWASATFYPSLIMNMTIPFVSSIGEDGEDCDYGDSGFEVCGQASFGSRTANPATDSPVGGILVYNNSGVGPEIFHTVLMYGGGGYYGLPVPCCQDHHEACVGDPCGPGTDCPNCGMNGDPPGCAESCLPCCCNDSPCKSLNPSCGGFCTDLSIGPPCGVETVLCGPNGDTNDASISGQLFFTTVDLDSSLP